VLQEAARLDLAATGFEINPSAYAMSKFFTFCNMTYNDRHEFCNSFENILNSQISKTKGQRVFVENKDYRKAYRHLLDFAINLNNLIENKQQRIFLLNILFQSEKDKSLLLRESLYKSF